MIIDYQNRTAAAHLLVAGRGNRQMIVQDNNYMDTNATSPFHHHHHNQNEKSRISSLLTTLSAQLDLIKANFAARQRLNQTTSTTVIRATLVSSTESSPISTRTTKISTTTIASNKSTFPSTTTFSSSSSSSSSSSPLLTSFFQLTNSSSSSSSPSSLELDEAKSISKKVSSGFRIIDLIADSIVQNQSNESMSTPTMTTMGAPVHLTYSGLCSCANGTLGHQTDKISFTASGYEINNIWKLAFFILAFFIGFVSLLLILMFALKIIVSKLNKRKMIKYDVGNYYLPNHYSSHDAADGIQQKIHSVLTLHAKKAGALPSHALHPPPPPPTASISMLEFDPDLSSSQQSNTHSGINLLKKSNHHNHLNEHHHRHHNRHSRSGKKRTSSGGNLKSSSPNKFITKGSVLSSLSTSSIHHYQQQQQHQFGKHKSSINSRSTSLTSSGSQAHMVLGNHHFAKEPNYITEEELLECQQLSSSNAGPKKHQHESALRNNNNNSQQCYIYGITNRGFLDDDSQISGFFNPSSNSSSLPTAAVAPPTTNHHQHHLNHHTIGELRASNLLFDSTNGSTSTNATNATQVTTMTTNKVPVTSFRPLPKPAAPTAPPKPIPSTTDRTAADSVKGSTNRLSNKLDSDSNAKTSGQMSNNNKSAAPTAVAITDEEIDHMNMKKLMSDQLVTTYQMPWKPPNDYEALETNTVTGSLANLSSVTTFSEIYSETNKTGGTGANGLLNDVNVMMMNIDLTANDECTATPNASSSDHKSSSSSSSYSCSSSATTPPQPPPPQSATNSTSKTATASSKEFVLTCCNTNEHISRSSKITQELEARLRERRQLMESKSDKFQPKLLHESELQQNGTPSSSSCVIGGQAISLSHLEKKLQNWSNIINSNSNSSMEKTTNIQPSMIKAAVVSSTTTISNRSGSSRSRSSSSSVVPNCVCPCHVHDEDNNGEHEHSDHHLHHHHHDHYNLDINAMNASPTEAEKCGAGLHKTSILVKPPEATSTPVSGSNGGCGGNGSRVNSGAQRKNSNNGGSSTIMLTTNGHHHKNSRKPKIIIDGSSTLPTKRESIRMLIENKAVSENKQKNALEMHLNTLLCSRKTATNTTLASASAATSSSTSTSSSSSTSNHNQHHHHLQSSNRLMN